MSKMSKKKTTTIENAIFKAHTEPTIRYHVCSLVKNGKHNSFCIETLGRFYSYEDALAEVARGRDKYLTIYRVETKKSIVYGKTS